MESKATLYGISRDFKTNKPIVSFLMDSSINPEADLSGDLRITVRRWRERRSLDANGYMWVILTQMALTLGSTKEEVYEEMLDRYGKEYRDEDGGMVVVGVKKGLDMKKAGHWKRYKDDEDCAYWYLLKGSSDYDTKEMSDFLDRVIEEAKELGIDTATPDEVARMKALYDLSKKHPDR